MKKPKHTKGPWKWWEEASGRPKKYDLMKLLGADGYHILGCYGKEGERALVKTTFAPGTSKKKQQESIANDIANARLIAAAPELLQALEELASSASVELQGGCSNLKKHLAIAKTIISKAKGE